MTSKQGVNEVQAALTSGPVGGAEPQTPDRLTGTVDESAVVVEHLSKRFGSRVAFDDVSFEVGYGEVFGFLGPNGAGKTTTVRTLGTLIAPTSGSATVAGIPLERRERPGHPAADLDHARVARPLPPPDRGREPGVLRRALRAGRRAGRASSEALEAVNLTDRANDLCGVAVQGPAPASRSGPGPAQRPGGAVPRRADLGPRPGGGA